MKKEKTFKYQIRNNEEIKKNRSNCNKLFICINKKEKLKISKQPIW